MSDDVEVSATAENISEEKSIEDTLRETLNEINSRNLSETDERVEHEEEVKAEVPEKNPVKTKPKIEAKKEPIAEDFSEVDALEDTTEDKVEIPALPNTWKKEAADAWAKADPVLRAEVERREADIHRGIERYKNAADFGNTMSEALSPFAETLKNLNINPADAVRELLSADQRLRYGTKEEKEVYFAQLARSYGIDLARTTEVSGKIDPRAFDLAQQNQRLQQQLKEQQLREQRSLEASLDNEIQAFANNPEHTHFEQVKMHMAALLQAGQAKDLSDAYEQAVYANPTTRAAVLQQQAKAMKEEASKKATAAKAAAGVNIKSRAPMPPKVAVGSMEDTIRDTYRRLVG